MSSYNSAWQEPLSNQTTEDVADGGGHQHHQRHRHHQQGHAQDLRQIQTYYREQDYEARGRRDPEWSIHRPYVHDGIGYYHPEAYETSYPQQQYYHSYRFDYAQQTYPLWNGGQGCGYSTGAVYSPTSLYDTPSDYQDRAPPYGVTLRAQFDKRDVAPVGDTPPRSPSPSYLSNSLSPSGRDEYPSRKLLILDLNGTLLLRSSPPRFRPQPPPRSPSPRATDSPQRGVPHPPPPSQPVKRAVYARPYLPCFREYLFHSSTRCWLDVMIWSSAQPHSVQAMLQKCFPIKHMLRSGTSVGDVSNDNKPDDRFIAVWARDTLGLSRFDYSRKTPTTKDLFKPWRQLRPMSRPDNKAAGVSSSPNDPSISGKDAIRHSARTTLLLDDSPSKAYLQPWNHVCLKEYDAAARHRDLKVLQDNPQKIAREHIDNGTFGDDLHTAENSPSTAPPPVTTESSGPTALYQPSFDATLLAIIGILEAVKHESNVAGWIRGNGLWVKEYPDTATKSTCQDDAKSEPACRPVSSTKRPRDNECAARTIVGESKPIKRPRLHISPQPDTNDSTADSLDLSAEPSNSSTPVEISKTHDSRSGMEAKHSFKKHADNILPHIGDSEKVAPTDTASRWFSHAPTFAHWVSRGRDALARLGIDERHGVSEDEL